MSPGLSEEMAGADDFFGRRVEEDDALESGVLTDAEDIFVPDVWEEGGKGVESGSGAQDVGELGEGPG